MMKVLLYAALDTEMSFDEFRDGGHLGYGNKIFSTILNLHVALVPHIKFQFNLMLNVPINSYGHVGMVSSPNRTFFLGKLD